jgi:hypothetical protein
MRPLETPVTLDDLRPGELMVVGGGCCWVMLFNPILREISVTVRDALTMVPVGPQLEYRVVITGPDLR